MKMPKIDPSKEQFTHNGAKRCQATNKAGTQCGRPSILGGTVCNRHGGRAPQVKRAAALRLLELIDPAIACLAAEMKAGEKSADRIRAANSILDRAGMPRTVATPDSGAAVDLLAERLKKVRDSSTDALVETGGIPKELEHAASYLPVEDDDTDEDED